MGYDYYQKAKQKPGFKPQRYTLKLVARYLIRSKNWNSLFSLCKDFKDFQVLPDRGTCCNLIISTCIKARKLKLVDNFLEIFLVNDNETAVLAFDFAMKGYNQLHMYSSTGVLYERMKSSGLDLSPACYSRVMEAYMKTGHHEKAVLIFQELEHSKTVKFGEDEMLPRSYWILCESLGKLGRAHEALGYFREMSRNGVPENHLIYSSLISSFASAGDMKTAEELLLEAEGKNMLRDPALFLKLVLRYVADGPIEKTLDVVVLMQRAKIRVSDCILCAIVNGFSKKRGFRAGSEVYERLVSRGCEPGQVTYASVLNMYFRLGLYPKAEKVFSEMEEKGYNKCVVAYSTMVAAYGKMGRTRDAARLVAKMKERGCEPNVWIYNSLLDMNGKGLDLRLVEKTWKEMKRRKIMPDRVSYTTVISAYNRAREFETCVRYYGEFKLTGGKIDKAMAGIMVAVFSKTNRVDELVELLQDMKVQGTKLDARFYRSAMNALRDTGLQVQARWLEEMLKCS
ncbi:pentatricopeptide repeat-containing protein at5g13770 chloroplastic [Phtheirospermum japonicum]|uniref:Pentatricopeptide repeat-containing protein at5g13770 chloroplastic n=1 Tax=Phtheirospermum japonicum TaxID=374723 RepID=A0A830CUN5_9LAMI|nr:pentatricopeptide repeat-containing protein at5g13770 chloroplastic [Phtheirospermum japonicum]